MFGFPLIKILGGTTIVAILLLPTMWMAGRWAGYKDGYDSRVAEEIAADLLAEQIRNADDEELAGMSDYDLCVDALRSRGLRGDTCERLRGVHTESTEP